MQRVGPSCCGTCRNKESYGKQLLVMEEEPLLMPCDRWKRSHGINEMCGMSCMLAHKCRAVSIAIWGNSKSNCQRFVDKPNGLRKAKSLWELIPARMCRRISPISSM